MMLPGQVDYNPIFLRVSSPFFRFGFIVILEVLPFLLVCGRQISHPGLRRGAGGADFIMPCTFASHCSALGFLLRI